MLPSPFRAAHVPLKMGPREKNFGIVRMRRCGFGDFPLIDDHLAPRVVSTRVAKRILRKRLSWISSFSVKRLVSQPAFEL